MKEIGGYLEIDRMTGSYYHEGAIPLNCGRAALEYLIKAKGIKKLYIPYFCCDSILYPCDNNGVGYDFYHILPDFRPDFKGDLNEGEWLYIVNFYGQITDMELIGYKKRFGRIIVDHAQAYFQKPVEGIDTLYTCRKFFGVPDGAFLYTDVVLDCLERDESFERFHYLLGRFERSASEFYSESVANNKRFASESVKYMSPLTENFLRAIDYHAVEERRTENFLYLHQKLSKVNSLHINVPAGAFMYPLYIENGVAIREKLQKRKIFIPVLWPNVLFLDNCLEKDYAQNILPLPCDQRYDIDDMAYMVETILKLI